MNFVQAKIETWIKLIQLVELQDVLDDIQILCFKMNIHARPDSKLNENIFKLLLHLCRAADQFDKQSHSYETGKKIAELTKLLCSLLIDIPDDNNFVKCLFKIVRCLISLNLYEDAAEICCYLQPGKLYNPQNGTMELLTKVLSLWHVAVNHIYLALTKEFSNENYNNLKNVITYEMKMMQIAYKNYTKPLIIGISTHLDKVATIDKEEKYFKDFSKYMLEYLARAQLYLEKDEKYIIYCHILRIICDIICKSINKTDIESMIKTLDELFSGLKNLLAEDEECYQCFQQFQSLCATLLMPIENFDNDSAKNMQNIISCNLKIAQKYGYVGALKWNALSIAEIVEPLFIYLEKRIEADKCVLNKLLDTGILRETMNLFIHIDIDLFYMKEVSIKCKWCLDKVCTVKRDLYNAIVMKCRSLSLICKFSTKTLPKEMCILARKILEQNMKSIICEIKKCKCKRWIQLWNTCRTLIYNIGILFEHVHEESTCLFTLLCRCIFQLQEIDSSSKYFDNSKDLENTISFALHKLSVIYYKNGIYKKAMTACALTALLTYDQPTTKAFRMWANIKKYVSEDVTKLTIIKCLTNDKDQIKNEMDFLIDISNNKYDLIKLYLHEIRSLLEEKISFTNCISTLLEEFEKLEPSKCLYAHVIQLLGHYLLNFEYDSSVLEYYKRAMSNLKQDVLDSTSILCLQANLHFFTFLEELHMMNKQTQMEMQNTKFALYAPKLPELSETKSPNIVPAYTMVNIKKDSSLMRSLQKCLKKWNKLFKYDMNKIIKNCESNLILDILITAGEYCRLYRYEDYEIEVWKLAYRLALEMDDYYRIIYVTSRCISSRQINYNWITTAKKYAIKQKDSKDENMIRSIAIFWISLADFYFECGECNHAKQLLTEARNLSGISFFSNRSVYLLSLDTIIRNINLYKDNMQHQDYGSYIVESLIAMRNLHQDLLAKKCKSQMEYLFSCDVLFTMTINLSMRINSLLSFRGISADLVRRLKMAQSLGAVIRTAELLKTLCYIDLSRLQLDDCEVKLQGLEHVLDTETFELSMKTVHTSFAQLAVTPTKIVDPIRDVPYQDSSPVLGNKVFDLPKFTLHSNCDCYKCCNVSYQYLVFAATYIRAQLYASQSHIMLAFDHFHGVFKIRERLFEEEEEPVLPDKCPRGKIGMKRLSWQGRFYITDYVQLLIDFCYFLKTNVTSRQQEASDIANLAINVCRKYKLEGHPVYVSAKELAFDNEFQPVLTSSDYLGFMVPQSHDIDVSDYAATPVIQNVCVTPSAQNHAKKPLSLRRRRNPVALKITKVNMIWSDDEDDDSLSSSSSSSSSTPVRSTRSSRSRGKLVNTS